MTTTMNTTVEAMILCDKKILNFVDYSMRYERREAKFEWPRETNEDVRSKAVEIMRSFGYEVNDENRDYILIKN